MGAEDKPAAEPPRERQVRGQNLNPGGQKGPDSRRNPGGQKGEGRPDIGDTGPAETEPPAPPAGRPTTQR